MGTSENLQSAFAGESQANRKYLAFAKKAEEEGKPQIAKLFRAVAAAETVHAHSHLRVMKGIGTTEENLKTAIAGEAYEFQTMYPEFIAAAEKEAQKAARNSFAWANEVEKIHHQLYSQALESLGGGKDIEASEIWVCEVCGHTHVGNEPPERCPICNALRKSYSKIA